MRPASDQRLRRIEKRLRRIMEGPDGERCSLCRREFCAEQPSEATFGGVTKEGHIALVGICCANQLAEIVTGGVFLSNSSKHPPWQEDDADWFKRHPRRTHRLRPAFPGEISSRWPIDPALLKVCDSHIIVCQLESGVRQRMPCLWSKGAVLPESEEFAHALADLLTGVPAGTPFRSSDVEALARRYETGAVS